MSDDNDHIAPEDEGRVLAAEYVLGVLSAEERRKVEARMAEEASFAREVEGWEERLGGMASYVPPATPPAQTWLRIEASLGADRRRPPPCNRHRRGRASRSGAPSASAPPRWPLRASPGSSISARIRQRRCRARPLLATLTGLKTNQPNFVAAIGADGVSLTIVPAALLTTDKRSMELWLIPQGGKPASLGLIAAGQPVRLNVPPELLQHVGRGATLAVSLEPPGGSPTGQPTGEVIAHGNLTNL